MSIADAQIAEWERLAGGATTLRVDELQATRYDSPHQTSHWALSPQTIAFYNVAREAVPALIAALREAQRERDEARMRLRVLAESDVNAEVLRQRDDNAQALCEARAQLAALREAARGHECGAVRTSECPKCQGDESKRPCEYCGANAGCPACGPECRLAKALGDDKS